VKQQVTVRETAGNSEGKQQVTVRETAGKSEGNSR